jgi:hypothetical protein
VPFPFFYGEECLYVIIGQFNDRSILKITYPKGERIKICAVLPYTVHMSRFLINTGRFNVNRRIKK